MGNDDPAPNRVKPIPIQVLHHAQALAVAAPCEACFATMDMGWIALFYLLRPGEYCLATDNSPLRYMDVGISVGNHRLDIFTCPIDDLDRATASSLKFDDQKNRVRGEVIAHATSGHAIACPTRSLVRRLRYLRRHGAPPETPLCAYRSGNRWVHVSSRALTNILRTSAAALPELGYLPSDVSARSLRAGGAMALLCGNVDTHTIKLVGRWKSEAMFRYLHAQALPIIRNLARTMLIHGNFTLVAGAMEPVQAQQILNAVPDPDFPDYVWGPPNPNQAGPANPNQGP
jgi:hypothetical protein